MEQGESRTEGSERRRTREGVAEGWGGRARRECNRGDGTQREDKSTREEGKGNTAVGHDDIFASLSTDSRFRS